MRLNFGTCSVLSLACICGVATQEALLPAPSEPNEGTITPFVDRNGWVNPEDLSPMPQCVAQQDQSAWLKVMTSCTGRRCTRHFGVICTHQQWLTQLSCLSTGFSEDLVKAYLPYCSRSVLARGQLFEWILDITGRTWLVDVGDAIGLRNLSPLSLLEGYAAMGVVDMAPMCLTDSVAASSMEPFQSVLGSCSFTSNTRHTGNAARPWEYNEQQHSMVSLDSETVGYDLTRSSLAYGDYFDKRCLCKTFEVDFKNEPCSGTGLSLTKARSWLNATCGPTALPSNWTDGLMTTDFAYIPTENWHWPSCVSTMPRKIIDLADQCTTDACEADFSGYCNVRPAVDRACFCRDFHYDTCKGPCHIFEYRIEYVTWLHNLCGDVNGWHGLPQHWHQLAAPMSGDLIPWGWSITPTTRVESASHHQRDSTQACPSTNWSIQSLLLINIATLLAGLIWRRENSNPVARAFTQRFPPRSWFLPGLVIVMLYLFANWINAALVQSTVGYESVPIFELVLLWCSLPRLTWATVLLVSMRTFKVSTFYTVVSYLFAESLLQGISAYHMITAVNYGWEHGFYTQAMTRLKKWPSAQYMYAGALFWLVIVLVTSVILLQVLWDTIPPVTSSKTQKRQSKMKSRPKNMAEQMVAPTMQYWTRVEDALADYWTDKSWNLEETPLLRPEGWTYPVYGTLPTRSPETRNRQRRMVRLTLLTIISMCLLWIAQWLFWSGFINLGAEQYCPPQLGLLTLTGILSSGILTAITVVRSERVCEGCIGLKPGYHWR